MKENELIRIYYVKLLKTKKTLKNAAEASHLLDETYCVCALLKTVKSGFNRNFDVMSRSVLEDQRKLKTPIYQ